MDGTVLAIVAFNEFTWFALLALLFSGGPARAFYRRAKFWLDRLMGGALALLGSLPGPLADAVFERETGVPPERFHSSGAVHRRS